MSISKVSGKAASGLEQAKPNAESRLAKGAFRDAMKSVETQKQTKNAENPKPLKDIGVEKETIETAPEEPSLQKDLEGEVEALGKYKTEDGVEPGVDEAQPERLDEEPIDALEIEQDSEEFVEFEPEAATPDELIAAGLQPKDNAIALNGQVEVKATTGPEARHEVVQKLIETMVTGGQLGEDSKGRKVMMMDVNCPGRGNVRVRLWKKGDGIELRMRADNPELKSLLMLGRSDLQASAKEKGVNFSKIEVAE